MRFEDMKVWKDAARLATEILLMSEHVKYFGFRDQIMRSAVSIASNIAEGSQRNSSKELIQFLGYAKGSCAELRTQLYIGVRAKFLNAEQAKNHIDKTHEISAMLHALSQTIRKKIRDRPRKE